MLCHERDDRPEDRRRHPYGDQALVRFGRGRLLDDDRFDPDIASGCAGTDRPSPIATRAQQVRRVNLIER